MRALQFLLICLIISFLPACGGETSTGTTTDVDQKNAVDTIAGEEATADSPSAYADLPLNHDCTVDNEVLEGNQIWIRETGTLVAITADETTLDENYGPGHRVLEVYNTETCEQIKREVLPVNVSPDFPYFLAEITYNNESTLVGIRGARIIYIYDAAEQQLLGPLEPQYLSNRLSEDAQSGNILRLEVWEHFLIGFAEDRGTFAFDLDNAEAPEAILPIAEFPVRENEFISLFAFPSDDERVQLALPNYDREADQFSINALYTTPQDINTTVAANVRDNRYIVLRKNDTDRTAVAIDMQERELIDLPDDIAGQGTQSVLQWIRQR